MRDSLQPRSFFSFSVRAGMSVTKSCVTTFKSSTKTLRRSFSGVFIGKVNECKDVAGKADGREGVHSAVPTLVCEAGSGTRYPQQ